MADPMQVIAERNLRSYVERHVPEGPDRQAALRCIETLAALRAAPEVIRIPAGDGLDPITLYVEDAGNGSGHLTITCYADAWICYWGSMGCGLTEFVAGVGADYLLSSMLWPNLGSTSKKTQAYVKRIAQRVIDQLAARPQGVKDGR